MSSDPPPSRFADEQIAAHARAAQLVGLPWPERLRVVREDRSYSVPSFIELAIGISRDLEERSAEREEWARLGVEAALHGSSRRVQELEPLAWANLGSTRRVRGRLRASRAAFMRCDALRHRLGDPLDLAETCALEASYWGAILELDKAAELIGEALRLARPYAEDSVIGRYEIQAGTIASEAGDQSVAVTMRLSSVERIDPAVHPRLALTAGHNLALTAVRLGHLDTAMCAVLRLGRSYDRFAEDPKLLLRREGLVAEIAKARGHWREAEILFRAQHDGFIEHQMPYEAAQIDFELAELAARTGCWATAAHLAARSARALSSAGSPREAGAATHLLREVALRRRGSGA